jgi:putative nucleotidyltransferase with HDIG domain
MTEAENFLGALGRALSVSTLYGEGHPTLERAVEAAWQDLRTLLDAAPHPTFTFLDEGILFGDLPLGHHGRFEWAERLADAGIQRLQFEGRLTRDEFKAFLADVAARVAGHVEASAPARLSGRGVRYGAVGLHTEAAAVDLSSRTATLRFALDAEIDTTRWVHEAVAGTGLIPLAEVETIVCSLGVAMHANAQMMLPLVGLKEFDQYTTTHSLNVSVLAMGLAERLDLRSSEVRTYGMAGLLHDIGKTALPKDVLTKPGRLTEEEREIMNRHPAEGARLILRSDEDLEVAAIVAYEHHVTLDGGGYPTLPDRRACLPASRLVHVCDVFDALRTHRPYRDAWPLSDAVRHLRERAGIEFDPALVQPFIEMVEARGEAPACCPTSS